MEYLKKKLHTGNMKGHVVQSFGIPIYINIVYLGK